MGPNAHGPRPEDEQREHPVRWILMFGCFPSSPPFSGKHRIIEVVVAEDMPFFDGEEQKLAQKLVRLIHR